MRIYYFGVVFSGLEHWFSDNMSNYYSSWLKGQFLNATLRVGETGESESRVREDLLDIRSERKEKKRKKRKEKRRKERKKRKKKKDTRQREMRVISVLFPSLMGLQCLGRLLRAVVRIILLPC